MHRQKSYEESKLPDLIRNLIAPYKIDLTKLAYVEFFAIDLDKTFAWWRKRLNKPATQVSVASVSVGFSILSVLRHLRSPQFSRGQKETGKPHGNAYYAGFTFHGTQL